MVTCSFVYPMLWRVPWRVPELIIGLRMGLIFGGRWLCFFFQELQKNAPSTHLQRKVCLEKFLQLNKVSSLPGTQCIFTFHFAGLDSSAVGQSWDQCYRSGSERPTPGGCLKRCWWCCISNKILLYMYKCKSILTEVLVDLTCPAWRNIESCFFWGGRKWLQKKGCLNKQFWILAMVESGQHPNPKPPRHLTISQHG